MKKLLKITITAMLIPSVLCVGCNVSAGKINKSEELKIIDKTKSNFDFMGVCGRGVVIKSNPDLKSQNEVTFMIGGNGAKGEIGYIDNIHHQVINFDYDYTKPGGDVTVKGGDQYYRFTGYCTMNGNEIIITEK